MDDWPDIKPPCEFTGKGFEIIGDPAGDDCQGTLWFQDGVFDGFGFPRQNASEPWTPAEAKEWDKQSRRHEAERLALSIREQSADPQAKADLRAIMKQCREESPRDRAAERAVKTVKQGGPATHWPARLRRDRVAIIALMETAKEYGRPPTESEVIDRMTAYAEEQDGRDLKVLQGGERKHLAQFLREMGFAWLERSPLGRPRGR